MTLFWLLPSAVALHIIEEFVFPGGFRRWYQEYKPLIASSLTNRFLVTVNTILVVACILPILIGMTQQGVALWLTVVAIIFSNSFFHVSAVLKTRRYSPGVVTSVLLYLPLPLYGYWYFFSTGQASLETALVSFALGSSYQWWSRYNHRRRSQSGESTDSPT